MIMIRAIIKYIFGIHWTHLLLSVLIFALFFSFLAVSTEATFNSDITDSSKILNNNNQGIVLYDIHNRPFFTFYQGRVEKFTSLSNIPDTTQKAVIAAEDKEFYSHGGFSLRSITRSAIDDIQRGTFQYGGSTLTQQLVKNSLLTSQKNFLRKLQEVILAQSLESRYSKDQILEMYLNSVYFGEGAFGIQNAAQAYFHKDAKDLDLAQSAMLAGLLPAPSELSPISGDYNQAKERQKYVLSNMVQQGYITQDQAQKAANETLLFNLTPSNGLNNTATAFALMVRDQLIQKYGEDYLAHSGFKVYTSLNLDWQQYAENYTKNYIKSINSAHVSNAAVVVIDPRTGEVRALVGSYDWNDPKIGKVNTTTTPRQTGSSFKPIVYLTAFTDNTITPASILQDKPTVYRLEKNNPYSQIYSPHDYDGKFRGNVTVRRALANSLNVPTVQVADKTGIQNIISTARQFGITAFPYNQTPYLSIALGSKEIAPLELTGAYATLANQGKYNPITLVDKITDKQNNTLFQYQPNPVQVADPKNVYQVTSILSDPQSRAEEFGTLLNTSLPAAVKTGTTDDFKDAWTMGYTLSLAVGVWIGNNDHTPMNSIQGSIGAAPLWKNMIETFSKGTPAQNFTPPPGLNAVKVCRNDGLLLPPNAPDNMGYTEYFVKGTEPASFCSAPTPSVFPNPANPSTPPSAPPSASNPPLPTQAPNIFVQPPMFPNQWPFSDQGNPMEQDHKQ